MADLSAYIDFSVRLDYTQNKILLTDTGTYPGIVNTQITGKFDITHPDLITEDGSWTSPDIIYSGGSLTTSLRDLRRSSANLPQKGIYTIVYTIDHPDYVPTVLTKTFNLQFVPIEGEITKNFDVFTPLLTVSDDVVYTVANFTTTSTTRSWNAVVGTVGIVTGASSTLDLSITGNYYDATYVITLGTTLIYTHTTDTWLSVKWLTLSSLNTTANTPPDTCSLLSNINVLKLRMDALAGNCQNYDDAKATFEYATSLYMLILQNLLASTTSTIITYVEELLVLYYNAVPAYTNTNALIPAYSLCYPLIGGGGSSTITKLSVTMPNPEDTTYTNAAFSGKTLLLTIKESLVVQDGDITLSGTVVTKVNIGDTFIPGDKYIFILKST